MPMEIIIPRLGWSMEEANFVNWLKKDGERVKSGEPLFTLESEKATQDVEAVDSGILRISVDGPKPGQVIKVGQVIGHLLAEDEQLESAVFPSTKSVERAQETRSEEDSKSTGKDPVSRNEKNAQVA